MTPDEKDAAEQLIDLLVYAPLGLALEYRTLMPELAERGRKQLGFARSVGKLALGGLAAQADRARRDSSSAPADTTGAKPATKKKTESKKTSPKKAPAKKAAAKKAPAKKAAAKKAPAKKAPAKKAPAKKAPAKKAPAKKAPANKAPAKKAAGPGDAAVNAVLASYDTLTARAIIAQLEDLTADQLRTVAAYESAKRQRTTVLKRVEQLLG